MFVSELSFSWLQVGLGFQDQRLDFSSVPITLGAPARNLWGLLPTIDQVLGPWLLGLLLWGY